LELDPFTRRCHADGRVIELTPRESGVLAVVMRHHPGVASKAAILAEVWGPDFDGERNIVDVYVSQIRRKLAAVHATWALSNVRGIGFRTEPT
jgi:DNA-binding response OmpR family regulator